jgi:methylmalonyl-CoA/ethylmalonyl-CoA epimerase
LCEKTQREEKEMISVQRPNSTHGLVNAFQVCVVVPDVEAAMAQWWEEYGVGPWKVWDLGPHNLTDQEVDERPEQYAFRCAITQWGPLEFELIQPLDERSIYAQSLAEHGQRPHLHHLHCEVEDYDATLEHFRSRGHRAKMSGGLGGGARFCYLSTDEEVGAILEIHDWPGGWQPPEPDLVYPTPEPTG